VRVMCSKSPLSEVVPAEVGWLPVASHKLVENVDTLHVMHDTKGKVLGDIIGAIHPAGDRVHEVLDLASVTLSTSSKVLTGKLSDPDVPVEGGMEILAVLDECLRISAIPMDGNGINRAASAVIKEVLQPSFAARSGGDCGRHEVVAFALKGLEVLLPEGSSVAGIKARLGVDIGFVEA